MKNNLFKNRLIAIFMLFAMGLAVNNAMAQSSINIKINPLPTGTISTSSTSVAGTTTKYICNANSAVFGFTETTNPTTNATLNTTKGSANSGWDVLKAVDSTTIVGTYASIATGATLDSANITFTNTTTNPINVIVRVYFKSANNCENFADFPITIMPTPAVSLTLGTIILNDGDDTTACEGSATNTLSLAMATVTGTSFNSWSTSNASAGIGAVISGNTIYFTNSGTTTGTIDLVLTYNITPDGTTVVCTKTTTVTITVSPTVEVTSVTGGGTAVTPTAGVYKTALCSGTTSTFTVTLAGNPTINGWDTVGPIPADVTVTEGIDGTFTFVNTGTSNAIVKLKVNYTGVCATAADIEVVEVTVYPQITVTLAASAGTTPTTGDCANTTSTTQEVTLTVKAAGGCPSATGYTVTLAYPAGVTITANPTDGITDNGNGTVTIVLTNAEAISGKAVTINVPTNGTNYAISTNSAATTGGVAAGCLDCTRTAF